MKMILSVSLTILVYQHRYWVLEGIFVSTPKGKDEASHAILLPNDAICWQGRTYK